MTSSPSQQCARCPSLGCVVWGADCCTPPRLWVISWSITVGCPIRRIGLRRRVGPHDRRQPARVALVAGAGAVVVDDLGDAPHRIVGELVGQDEHVARAREGADGGRHVVGQAAEVARVVAVVLARARQRDHLDVDVLRPALRAHVEAQRAGAARLHGEVLLDVRDVGLQRVAPLRRPVLLAARVGVDDLDLALRRREGGELGVVGRQARATPRRGRVPGQVGRRRARQVRDRQCAGDVGALEIGRRVDVVGAALVVGAGRRRKREQQVQRDEDRSCEAHDLPVVGVSAPDLDLRRTHDGAPDLHP